MAMKKPDSTRKNDSKMVWDALVMVLQFGINMLVPILACTFIGVWLGNKFSVNWLAIPCFFLGAIAGGQNVYRMARKFMK